MANLTRILFGLEQKRQKKNFHNLFEMEKVQIPKCGCEHEINIAWYVFFFVDFMKGTKILCAMKISSEITLWMMLCRITSN